MELSTFQALTTEKVAELVRASGPKTAVFPINGTRRWFVLEHGSQNGNGLATYMPITWRRQIELYKLFFDHGVDTLLTPIFGPDLLERGDEYSQLIMPGLLWLSQNQEMLEFYREYEVRVRVYGDARRCLAGTAYASALDAFDEITRLTAGHRRHHLFFGVCAHDPAESVAEIGLHFYQAHGRLPDKREIVTAYYGEYVEPVSFFIGFDRPAAFDMPLIATGSEDLYFTVSPSPYLEARTLRAILYDHLYTRRVSESYDDLPPAAWQTLASFYRLNRHHVLGLGRRSDDGSFWYPLPQVKLPPQLKNDKEIT
ncbi:MAG: diterpene synthase [Chloroflexi bacterium]|nr:diterpene synthase [Chloroflexota bacterium]MCI0578565.1 diterpene synthase [Chloroflexota bacterium]MCI0645085.1 diterpene synthase [Chloroflexota bacterium]MCI0731920.1 diterpene synthase [Chloroflexota bacterium]